MADTQLFVVVDGTMNETAEVIELYEGVKRVLDHPCQNGKKIGDCKNGVYLFYDYDGEPIYVGQTREKLRTRIGRHLTNQRTDAVAMSVLDPFEVAEIEMWPFWESGKNKSVNEIKEMLNRAEFTVYCQALKNSKFSVVLNENDITKTELIVLPESIRESILSAKSRRQREHPDLRLARRARTIANLARIISERKVKIGIRKTLWAQAKRLEHLAQIRLEKFNKK